MLACDNYEALKATRHESETICQRRLGQTKPQSLPASSFSRISGRIQKNAGETFPTRRARGRNRFR